MRIIGHRGTRLHAPENSLTALVSAYTAGADGLEFELQLTKDGDLVLSHDPTTDRMTGSPGRIIELTLAELRALDFGKTFKPPGAPPNFRYYRNDRHSMSIYTLDEILEQIPPAIPKMIGLGHDATLDRGRRRDAVERLVTLLRDHGQLNMAVVFSKDPEALKLLRSREPRISIATFDDTITPPAQMNLMRETGADGLFIQLSHVFTDDLQLTDVGRRLLGEYEGETLRVGAALRPGGAGPWSVTREQYAALSRQPFAWGVLVDSIPQVTDLLGNYRPWLVEAFDDEEIDTRWFALGYAKANPYCHVFQRDGIHIKIRPYDGPRVNWPAGSIESGRIATLERDMMYVAKNWPYYSGGGVGIVRALRGDFVAEVEYEITEPMKQSTTLEMAVVNCDPGAHQRPWDKEGNPRVPSTNADKDSFFDPHGAPPHVGVEHDEDDGYRINWNLGVEYDNNHYGRPVGDGKSPRRGRLRLERRDDYFSAYYRNDVEAADWVCVGTICNESLNRAVHLRCVAKRWWENAPDSEPLKIPSNEFTFRNLNIMARRAGAGER